MFNKRGIGHEIDWILGVGMFILAVAFIFVLFKPGVTPVYDSQTLLNILQDGFEYSTNWEITHVPIFIAPLYSEAAGKNKIILSGNSYEVEAGGEGDSFQKLEHLIDGKNAENIKLFYVKRGKDEGSGEGSGEPDTVDAADDLTEVETEISLFCQGLGDEADDDQNKCICSDNGQECSKEKKPKKENIKNARDKLKDYQSSDGDQPNKKAFREKQLKVTINNNGYLIFPAFLDETGNKTKYLLVVSDKQTNFILGNDVEELKGCYTKGSFVQLNPSPYIPNPGDPLFADLDCHVVYELGVEEKLSGINLPLALGLNDLDCGGNVKGYDCAKELWKFPALKEFDIAITSIDGIQSFAQFPTNRPEPTNVNIFVRSYNTFMLTEDGLKIPAKVRLRLWQ